ncbi:MAG: leucine-rich repeat protein [Anaerobutyricum soehngenii]
MRTVDAEDGVYDETRPALGHDWKDNGDGTATCQREGCGKSHTHTLDEGEVTKKPSCEEKGVKTYRCTETNCNYTKTEDIAATGHNWNDGKITTKASCDHTGVKIYTCKTCGDTRTETIAMLEHTWDDGQVTTKPSCTEKGIRTYTCNVCKETKTEELEATGHQHTEIRGKKDATCTETGYTGDTYCKDCDTKLSDGKEIPATGHQNKEVRDKKAATCTKAGYTGDTYCKDCGELLKTGKETDALGHTWGKGKVTRKSTYTAAGQITYTCSRCGEKRVITTKKLFYPKAGTKYTVAGCQYKVIKAGAEVSLVGTNKNAKSVTIPAVIKVKGVTYKVTSIGTKAFNGSKKLTKVTIGANIKKISNNAFFKCKSLKMVNIKSVLLTKKTANKKAFKGTNKKMVIKVPKKVKKAYVKMFKGLKVK